MQTEQKTYTNQNLVDENMHFKFQYFSSSIPSISPDINRVNDETETSWGKKKKNIKPLYCVLPINADFPRYCSVMRYCTQFEDNE